MNMLITNDAAHLQKQMKKFEQNLKIKFRRVCLAAKTEETLFWTLKSFNQIKT